MRKFVLTMVMAACSVMVFGQVLRDNPGPPVPGLFADDNLQVDPLVDLQTGTNYLMNASNTRIYGGVFMIGGLLMANRAAKSTDSVVSLGATMAPALIGLGGLLNTIALVQDRKGKERLYLGMNGITIKLNN